MNHSASTTMVQPWPITRILARLSRMIPIFGECMQSLRCLRADAEAQIRRQQQLAADIAAIDDAMERAAPILAECLRNDPPAKRRLIWAAWQEAHRLTELRAREASPNCPPSLRT